MEVEACSSSFIPQSRLTSWHLEEERRMGSYCVAFGILKMSHCVRKLWQMRGCCGDGGVEGGREAEGCANGDEAEEAVSGCCWVVSEDFRGCSEVNRDNEIEEAVGMKKMMEDLFVGFIWCGDEGEGWWLTDDVDVRAKKRIYFPLLFFRFCFPESLKSLFFQTFYFPFLL